MTSPLQQLDIFELRPLITNFNCKLSTISEYDCHKQMLCLVSEENDIVLRYTSEGGQEVLKLVTWFRRTNRVIHDICFDPSGTWLLVLCFDNTLHIVPALAVVDKSGLEASSKHSLYPHTLYSTTQVTSYIIPFVGPHECPNSKKCPNKLTTKRMSMNSSVIKSEEKLEHTLNNEVNDKPESEAANVHDLVDHLRDIQIENYPEEDESLVLVAAPGAAEDGDMDVFSHDVPAEMLASSSAPPCLAEDKTGNSQLPAMSMSFMASNTCPYPLSVVWWRTLEGINRAVIGYSDGSICFVGLSPNCPFVASTTVQAGSVVKLLICRDNTFDSVMLLITTSLKQQFKLLLEQKAIKYIYPGELSPTATQTKDSGEWQIVMPLKGNTTAGTDNASERIQSDDDVFIVDESAAQETSGKQAQQQTLPLATQNVGARQGEPPPGYVAPSTSAPEGVSTNSSSQQPPPPPYSVAITRHLDNKGPITTTASSAKNVLPTVSQSQQQQQQQDNLLNDLEDSNGRPGILPAARARLASLKSLGSKKLNAIKMRLSDNRQKIEEYMPDNSLGSSFAIVDSPSLTPELLANSSGSFYTIQNLRSTYLLSALHSQSKSFTVHSIDIHLKPLFLYKIPPECVDILISSNILYSIQYVDHFSESKVQQKRGSDNQNTEKENLDMDVEKQEKYAGEMKPPVVTVCDDKPKDKKDPSPVDSVADTSTASSTSEPSSQDTATPSSSINAVGVISSAMASLRTGDEDRFNGASQLGLFRFENETVLSLYQMASFRPPTSNEMTSKDDKDVKILDYSGIRSPMDYVRFYETADVKEEYTLRQMEIMQNEFPRINYDPCYVVTNKNVYYIQLKKEPFAIFLESALASEWTQCRDFCNTFDLTYEACIEFAGDYLLRQKKVTKALLTYNTARIKPIRTALKLAMFGQTNALMHLCAMALKLTHILKSKFFCHPIIATLMDDVTLRHSEDVRPILPPSPPRYSSDRIEVVNEGLPCSDYTYGVDEPMSQLQMSPSSQFHLANLLLITLAEKAVNDKNYIPLWNFLVTNGKYHTNMTSIVLCQSGLFSAALLLAKVRGVCIDTFLALNSVVGQEFGWYAELNVCLFNLSEPMFTETITYLPSVSIDYFSFIQDKLHLIRPSVLKRLEQQLNPFSAIMRPIVSHTSTASASHLNDNNTYLLEFCKNLVETYLAVLIHMDSQRSNKNRILNALNNFRISYEDNQFAIEATRFKPISAGCAHCACVVDGVAYFWGSNGVPCNYSVNKSSDSPEPPYAVKSLDLLSHLNLHVHAVKCGRQHTLLLTNNGLYTLGNNNLCQLGIGKQMQVTSQPMLVEVLDGKNITVLEAGQYHNAVVADGILYTWGWGVYGQLGHGDTENVAEPKVVSYLKYKKVLQVSLGHAHSMVLCEGPVGTGTTELFVFGSNHFGQLGLGPLKEGGMPDSECKNREDGGTPVKHLLPQKLEFGAARIRLIHTKFFTNLVVDENERMYTWGSSPQALRLANQIKRRANAKQKNEENQRRRFEAILSETVPATAPEDDGPSTSAVAAAASITYTDTNTMPTAITPAFETTETIDKIEDASSSIVKDEILEGAALVSLETEMSSDVPLDGGQEKEETIPTSVPSSSQPPPEVDPCEHMSPHLVDTSEVAGQILQVSSGLFHFALISSSCSLYTWGKNLEHQLGTEDKERRAVGKPSPIDSIDRPMYVDCGADFTLVMTTDYVVKAFGGNSNGQCGRDLGACIDKMKQRVVCLPTTKRLMRFESQCVENPVEINLPRPRIRLDSEPVRYLKTIPRYKCYFLQEAEINFEQCYDMASSCGNPVSGQESDDMISSLENLSQNDGSSLQGSANAGLIMDSMLDINQQTNNSSCECSPDEQSYARLPNCDCGGSLIDNGDASSGSGNQQHVPLVRDNNESSGPTTEDSEEQQLCHYIHYCLYIFHGLYSPDKVRDFSKDRLEYRIRTYMLNFKFVDAFPLCLRSVGNASSALKVFEYFSKDTGYVPLRRADLRFLIYYLLTHFIERNYDLTQCENFLLADLDYYLMELAYVLYFNNNNTELEQNLNEKFKSLIARSGDSYNHSGGHDSNQASEEHLATHKLQDTDAIFETLSVKFKTIVCQRLLKFCNS